MTPERWQQIESLFHRALEHGPGEREAFLLAGCADPDLRRDVGALLREAEVAEDYFDDLAGRAGALHESMQALDGKDAPYDALAGRRIGSYLLEREIGRGGTSVVYLASRAEGAFRRSVAIKILSRQTHTVSLVRRFEREQQVLCNLSHPNIAGLYDGGVSEDGHSYFVMEHVDGCPIDQYCDRHRLTVDERLRLFITVAGAVEYAHKNLVIHRDLKPSNILVGNDETVKLLDFGIAKIMTDDRDAAPGGLTQAGERWLTPDYAAPEQVRGERTTTATDVYQLGIVLHELLTGLRPFPQQPAPSPYLTEKAVCESEPRRPSAVVRRSESQRRGGATTPGTPETVAESRRLDVRQLGRKLAGDLDAIVLRALQKDVSQRYDSVGVFARDVQCYLAGLPVEACEGRFRYRASKFLRRHRVPAAAAGLGALLLVGMSILYTLGVATERDRARIEAEKAGEVTEFVLGLFEAGHPEEVRGEVLTVPMLLERGLTRAEDLGGQPAVQAQVLTTIARAYHGLGEYDRSDPLLERALALRREHLGADHPDVAHGVAHLGWSRLAQGDFGAAEALFSEALATQRRTLGPAHPELANSLNGLGLAVNGLGRNAEAIRLLREALEIRRASLGDAHVEIANGLNDLAILLRTGGDPAGAEALVREGLVMRRALLGANHPDIARSTHQLASLLEARSDHAGAESLYLETLRIWRRSLGDGHPYTRGTLRELATLYDSWGRPAKAAALRELEGGTETSARDQ